MLVVLLHPSVTWCAEGRQAARSTANAVANTPALEREARAIETMLIAPCCWREQVSVHQSEAALQVKQEIRTMLASGMARQQVLDIFVERYSVRILAEPPNRGFGRVLYYAPWILGLGSALGAVLFIRRITRRRVRPTRNGAPAGAETDATSAPTAPGGDGSGESYDERLDDELRALD
jgi:cytochrome c-type biogenesis protein CcmH